MTHSDFASGSRGDVDLFLSVMWDFASITGDSDAISDRIVGWLDHIGFSIGALRSPRDLLVALPAHYRFRSGKYDVARLERDIATWESVAAAVAEARLLRDKSPSETSQAGSTSMGKTETEIKHQSNLKV